MLFKIILNSTEDIPLGIGVCHIRYLGPSLTQLYGYRGQCFGLIGLVRQRQRTASASLYQLHSRLSSASQHELSSTLEESGRAST
jgi:hypothetical protein